MSKEIDFGFLNSTPVQYSGGKFLNIFGFQIIRTLYFNFWRLKSKKVNDKNDEYLSTFEKNDILLIPDFSQRSVRGNQIGIGTIIFRMGSN